ncbi:MAG: hypothetical protein ACRC8Y_15875 [Chroococcales cyanobacterium]
MEWSDSCGGIAIAGVRPIARENPQFFLGSVGVKPLIDLTHRHPEKYSGSETRFSEESGDFHPNLSQGNRVLSPDAHGYPRPLLPGWRRGDRPSKGQLP